MKRIVILALAAFASGCSKKEDSPTPPAPQENFAVKSITINGAAVSGTPDSVDYSPLIKISFTAPVNRGTATGILLNTSGGASVSYTAGFENSDSTVTVRPSSPLASITKYNLLRGYIKEQ
jgi:hypothetical protein